MYPEATISRSFELKEFKSGAARMALEAGVPIVPMVIWGAQRIGPRTSPNSWGGTVLRSTSGSASRSPAHGVPADPTPDELTAELRVRMQVLLERAQQGYPAPAGARWLPARLGGGAPTPDRAAVLELEELERRRAARQN